MNNVEIVMIAGGIIACALVALEAGKRGSITLSEAATVVLGIVFILIALL